jgi:hypothetical protein
VRPSPQRACPARPRLRGLEHGPDELARAFVHGVGALVGDLTALVEEHEPLAHAVDLAQVVRGEQDRRARARVGAQQLEHLAALEGSRPSVGSSRMRTGTFGASAAAKSSWRFMPWL